MERSITKFCPIIGVFCVFLASPGCANALSLRVGTVDVALQTSCDSEHKLNVQAGGTTYCAPLTETWADNSVHVAFNNKTYTVCNGECPTNAGGGDEVPEVPPEPQDFPESCTWSQTNSNAYLLSDGNQYFDTGETVNSQNNIEVTVQVSTGINARIFGTLSSSCSYDLNLNVQSKLAARMGNPSGGSSTYNLPSGVSSTGKNTYKTEKSGATGKHIYVNGTKVSNSAKYVRSCTSSNTMLVLKNDYLSFTIPENQQIKLYEIKLWNYSGTLIHHFQPVAKGTNICGYTTPQNGMWDNVTKTFYLAGGSGVMGYGVDE